MRDVCFTVVIKENIRIDTFEIQLDWVAPSFHGVFSLYNHVSHTSRELSSNHIEGIIIGIVANSGSIYTGTDTGIFYFEL